MGLRSRITLTAAGDPHALLPEIAFHVDKGLMTRLVPGDTIHLVGTDCGGLGLSIVRAGELIVAVGAVTHVPLGRDVQAHVPFDVISRAEEVVRERDPGFEFPELPIEISVNGARRMLFAGYRTLGEYAIFARHGFFIGVPGTDVCASICRKGACSPQAAQASAMLLDRLDSNAVSDT